MSNEDLDNRTRQRDMILAPNEYAYISDETKGEISVYVGPFKTSLAGTDSCVIFDSKTKRFKKINLHEGAMAFQTAPEGWYVIMKNPAEQGKHPNVGGKQSTPDLKVGKKINIPGPTSFALYPGQMAKVVQGHNLKSNEYLLVRVYDEEAAKLNLQKAVVKTQTTTENKSDANTDETTVSNVKLTTKPVETKTKTQNVIEEADLSMGKLFVIRGLDVSFYIPPSGMEVVPEKVNGEERFVREAVSLELLEYCLLLDQDGTKRYVHGPAVVFPSPTEKFVEAPIKSNPEKAKAKKFRAQELTPASGIHIRVIKNYVEGKREYATGEELFITGKEQTIYYPREEHAIIKYGDQEMHYGIAIPAGEGRYVLNRETGVIDLVKGPQIFLPDPRNQVIAQRALPLSLCELLYPGNQEAYEINAARLGITDVDFIGMVSGGTALLNTADSRSDESYAAVAAAVTPDTSRRVMIRGASKSLPGDAFDRKNKFTAPRSIVLNTKYDGAVTSDIWPGYAMMLVSKRGGRRVVRGPATAMLEYDESPQVMTLSRGKPKTMDNPLKTTFLLTTANMVSDIIEVETKDFVKLSLKLSYRVNFEGDPEQWFNIDNYVKFLCDHMRSRLRSAVQKFDVEEFHSNHNTILRDVVLGQSLGEGKARTGTSFAENGMRIYDLEVLGLTFQAPEIEKLLMNAQRSVIQNTLNIAEQRRQLGFTEEVETIKQKAELIKAQTEKQTLDLQAQRLVLKSVVDFQALEIQSEADKRRTDMAMANEQAQAEINAIARAEEAANGNQRVQLADAQQQIELKKLKAQVEALVAKAGAITPELIAALQAFGDQALIEKISVAMGPMALLGGDSVVDVVKKLFVGTPLEGVVDGLKKTRTNGGSKQLGA